MADSVCHASPNFQWHLQNEILSTKTSDSLKQVIIFKSFISMLLIGSFLFEVDLCVKDFLTNCTVHLLILRMTDILSITFLARAHEVPSSGFLQLWKLMLYFCHEASSLLHESDLISLTCLLCYYM